MRRISGLSFPAQRYLVNKPPTDEEVTALRNRLDKWLGANDAVQQLIAVGCDVDVLLTLLAMLCRASTTDVWTKADLNDAAKLYERAANNLLRLKNWGEARNLGLTEDSERWLAERSGDLRLLTARLRERAPKADKRNNPRLGRALARLIHYARLKAESPLYGPLSVLISVATGRDRDPDTIRKWWANNAKKFADIVNHE
jgi:hypothetical protein